jgi:hypothetical protein
VGGCESDRAMITVNISSNPIATITPQGATIFCEGNSVLLKANTGTGLSYQWLNSSGQIAGETNSSYRTSTADKYQVIVTNGCGSKTSSKITVIVNPKAAFTDTIPNQIRCAGDSLSLTVNATGTNLSYQWTKGGNDITGASSSTYNTGKLSATDYDIYSCKVTNSCGTKELPGFIIEVISPPGSTTVYVTQTKYIGDTISYTISPSGTGPFSFQWYKSDVTINGATNSIFQNNYLLCPDSGIYTCSIKNGCDSMLSKVARVFIVNCSRFKFAISGYIKYDNADSTVMSSKTINTITTAYLKNSSDVIIDSVNTDDTDNYAFINIVNDTYTVFCKTKKPWGGVNPVDALMVNRYYIGIYKISDSMKLLAADVNGDSKINPVDALLINRRYINIIHKYPVNDWIFESPTVIIQGANAIKNIRAICAGDVNTSDVPPGKKSE